MCSMYRTTNKLISGQPAGKMTYMSLINHVIRSTGCGHILHMYLDYALTDKQDFSFLSSARLRCLESIVVYKSEANLTTLQQWSLV